MAFIPSTTLLHNQFTNTLTAMIQKATFSCAVRRAPCAERRAPGKFEQARFPKKNSKFLSKNCLFWSSTSVKLLKSEDQGIKLSQDFCALTKVMFCQFWLVLRLLEPCVDKKCFWFRVLKPTFPTVGHAPCAERRAPWAQAQKYLTSCAESNIPLRAPVRRAPVFWKQPRFLANHCS